MTQTLYFIFGAIGIVLAGCALFGWGRCVRRWAGWPQGRWPATVALGLAAIIFLGGLLNLSHLAYPWALDLILLTGLGLSVTEWRAAVRHRLITSIWPADQNERRQRACFYLLLLLTMGFIVSTQLAPGLHNPMDDFSKYFAHPARMVQTGTLRGSPLNALGSETLGGQAFLQGFFAGHIPIYLINGADAVFCFGLCLALAGGVALQRPGLGLAALAGMLAVLLIYPQYVNVSSLYSTAALLMALLLLTVDPMESGPESTHSWRRAIPPALIYAAVLALKPTGLFFMAVQFALWLFVSAWITRNWRAEAKNALATILWSGLFLSPWLLLFTPEYIAGWTHPLHPPSMAIPELHEEINLFSTARLLYDGSYLAYTATALGLGLYALAACRAALKRTEPDHRMLLLKLAASCAAAVFSYLLINLAGLRLVEAEGALRYSIPTLIAVTPVALSLGALGWDARGYGGLKRLGGGTWSSLIFLAVLAGLFFQAATHRLSMLANYGTQLGYATTWTEASVVGWSYEHELLVGSLAQRTARMQQKIPAGKKIVAWVEAPFQLDFKRNPIIDANESGVATAWSVMPETDYVLWQYKGPTVRSPQDYLYRIQNSGRRKGFVMARTMDFQASLQKLAAHSELVSDEEGFAIMRLKANGPTATLSPK